MKYIVTKDDDGVEEIFVFSRRINHDTMAEAVSRIRNQSHGTWRRVGREPVSAGFVDFNECHGESMTLRLKSRPQDTALLGNK